MCPSNTRTGSESTTGSIRTITGKGGAAAAASDAAAAATDANEENAEEDRGGRDLLGVPSDRVGLTGKERVPVPGGPPPTTEPVKQVAAAAAAAEYPGGGGGQSPLPSNGAENPALGEL